MATQSLLAKAGIRLTTLGSAASLAVAAPLAEGSESLAAATDPTRIGWFASRTPAQERFGVVVLGTERLAATAAGATVTGILTVTGAASIGAGITAGGSILTTVGAVTAKPVGSAGIAINPNSATGDFTLSLVPANLTANRTITFPDATGTVVASAGLTNGRVPYASGGLLVDSTLLTYDATPTIGGLSVLNTTASTSTTSGALVLGGGLGAAGAGFFGGEVSATDAYRFLSGDSTIVGNSAAVAAGVGIAIGYQAAATAVSIVIGSGATAKTPPTDTAGASVVIGSANAVSGGAGPRTNGGADGCVVIGTPPEPAENGPVCNGRLSVAIASSATAGVRAVALGHGAQGTGSNSIAIGENSSANITGANAFGAYAAANFSFAVAIGHQAAATKANQIRLGAAANHTEISIPATTASTSSITGALVVAGGVGIAGALVPRGGTSDASANTVIGASASTPVTQTVIVGDLAGATAGTASRDVFIGYNARATFDFDDCVAVGANTVIRSNLGVAIGGSSSSVAEGAVALGYAAVAGGAEGFGVAIGANARSTRNGSVALGGQTSTTRAAAAAEQYCIAIGAAGTTGARASGQASIAIGGAESGSGATASAAWSLAIGPNGVSSSGQNAIALGSSAAASANDAVAVGRSASASFATSVAIGTQAATTKANQIVLGNATNHTEVLIPTTTPASSTTTGALLVSGGAGVAGAVYAGSVVSSTINGNGGAITFGSTVANVYPGWIFLVGEGGSPTGDNTFLSIRAGANPNSASNRGIFQDFQARYANASYQLGQIGFRTGPTWGSPLSGSFVVQTLISGVLADRLTVNDAGTVNVLSTTASTSTATGALVVSGGVGIAGALFVGSNATISGNGLFGGTGNNSLIVRSGPASVNSAELAVQSTNLAFPEGNRISLKTYRGDPSTSLWGTNLANAATITLRFPSGAGFPPTNLFFGIDGVDAPIRIGINSSEVAQFTGGTLASDRLAVKYTAASTSTTTGALVVSGGIGVASGLTLGTTLDQVGSSAPAVSAAGQGRIYFDSSLNVFRVSENGGAYVNLVGSGGGAVTSVGLSMPGIFTVSGSPVTTSGTLTATLANQSANTVFAGPTTGSPAAPTFRSLVAADIPTLAPGTITGGTANALALFSGAGALTSSADILYSLSGGTSISLTTSPSATRSVFEASADSGNASFGQYGSTSSATIVGLALADRACVFADLDLVLHAGDASSSAKIYVTNFSGVVATFNGGALSAGSLDIAYTTTATSTTTGALTVAGGVGIVGDVYIGGKLNVAGLIDPTGLALDPQASNPGGPLAASTIWVNSADSNKLYFGASAVGGTGSTPAGANTQVQYNNSGAFGASTDFTWNNTSKVLTIGSSGVILMPETAASAPAYSFTGHTNYGMRYKSGFSQVCLTAGGVDKIIVGVGGGATYFRNGTVDFLYSAEYPNGTDVGDFINSQFIIVGQSKIDAFGGSTLYGKTAALSVRAIGSTNGTSVITAIHARTSESIFSPNILLSALYIDTTVSDTAAYSYGLFQAGHMNNQFQGYLSFGGAGGGFTPGVSSGAEGRIYYDESDNKFKVSENGGAYVNLIGSGGAPGGSDQQLQFNNAGAFGGTGYSYRTDSCDTVGSRGAMSSTFGFPATTEPAGVLFSTYGVADYNAPSQWEIASSSPGSVMRCSTSLTGESYDSSNLVDFYTAVSVRPVNNYNYFPTLGIACLHLSTLGYFSFPVPFYGIYQAGAYMDNHFDGFLTLAASAPAVSSSNRGRIYYDSGLQKFRASQNGGAYVDLVGSGPGGSDTQIQFNNLGAFGGSSSLTWNTGSSTLTLSPGGTLPTAPLGSRLRVIAPSIYSALSLEGYGLSGGVLVGRATGGSLATPTATTSSLPLLRLIGDGYDGSVYKFAANITLRAAENWTGSANGTEITFSTVAAGTTTLTEKFRIFSDGGMQLGGTFSSSPGAGSALFAGNLLLNSTIDAPTFTPIGQYAQIVGSAQRAHVDLISYGTSGGASITTHRAGGTIASPSALALGASIMGLSAVGWDGTTWQTGSGIFVYAESAWSGTSHKARMEFTINTESGAPNNRAVMHLLSSGGLVLNGLASADPGAGGLLLSGFLSTGTQTATASATISAAAVKFTGGSGQTLTLPATTVNGRQVFVRNTTTNSVLIAADAGNTIEGGATLNIAAFQSVALVLFGTDWTSFF